MFRPLRFAPHLLLALLLGAGLAVALATQFPQAPVIERAQEWPLVGPWAARFRAAYLPADPSAIDPADPADPANPPDDASPASPDIEIVRVFDPDLVGVKPKVWARPGTAIRSQPDPGSPVIARVEHLFPLSRLERRGDWFHVRYGTRLSGPRKGWVHLPDYREPTAEELRAPTPVLPLAPVAMEATARAVAERLLGATAGGSCGPFELLTDVRTVETLELCRRIGSVIETEHRRRYGLELVGETAETIVLFERETAYLAFRGQVAPDVSGDAFASPARGFVAVPAGGRPARLRSSLIHELTHLLNRRALGPALPPWLDEGMARDLETTVGGVEARPQAFVGRAEQLEVLFALDSGGFRSRAEVNYRSAGRWIGYLVAGPDAELAAGMRRFLRAVSRGEPIDAGLLLDHLGRDWSELEAGFRAWEGEDDRLAAP